MRRYRSIEFWLFALPAIMVIAVGVAWATNFHAPTIAKYALTVTAAAWMILAIAWMFRELVRRIRS